METLNNLPCKMRNTPPSVQKKIEPKKKRNFLHFSKAMTRYSINIIISETQKKLFPQMQTQFLFKIVTNGYYFKFFWKQLRLSIFLLPNINTQTLYTLFRNKCTKKQGNIVREKKKDDENNGKRLTR